MDLTPNRAHIALLATLCLGLLWQETPGDAQARASAAASVAVSSERIAGIVASANPELSPKQRQRIGRAVLRSSRSHGLDPQLVTAIILVESGARPWVRSPKGAVGLMQVMPHMAEPLGLRGNLVGIEHNVEAGCRILADNIRRLGEEDGISAYFWGSRIRGVAYLDRVRAAQETVQRHVES